ncbi:hypothetical protein BIV23_31285 [Streptomyces monashensis]|uniref:Transposase IS116/IS110/IS902 C-terminal domain-containing protein n=1 Tax=Streptomyces monashensis TaxID=1678012 RepID=A0A1S2PU51_9ACTN|nr:hypothetical protein BIV23_31285 [Streptomyces monashensis]
MLIAEIGLDMSAFPPSAHLASWVGVCPVNHASGGKRKGGRSRAGPKWLKATLTEAAWAAVKAKGTPEHATSPVPRSGTGGAWRVVAAVTTWADTQVGIGACGTGAEGAAW